MIRRPEQRWETAGRPARQMDHEIDRPGHRFPDTEAGCSKLARW